MYLPRAAPPSKIYTCPNKSKSPFGAGEPVRIYRRPNFSSMGLRSRNRSVSVCLNLVDSSTQRISQMFEGSIPRPSSVLESHLRPYGLMMCTSTDSSSRTEDFVGPCNIPILRFLKLSHLRASAGQVRYMGRNGVTTSMRRTIRRFLSMLKTMYMMTVLPSPGSRKNPAQASETPNSAQRIWNLCGLSFKISPCFVQDDIATFLSVEHYVDPVVIPMDRLMHVLLQRRQLASRPFEFHEECLPMGWVEHHIGPSGAYEESSDLVLLVEQPSGLGVRSEERRVGKECRSRWSSHRSKNQIVEAKMLGTRKT